MVATVTDIGSASATVHYFEQDERYAKRAGALLRASSTAMRRGRRGARIALASA